MRQEKDRWIGRTIGGRYKILAVIEQGGMGVVYRALQIAIDREVAIKMLRSDIASDSNWVERFQREAQACSALAHPNTIRLYDYGQTTRGDFFMVMELLKGRSLHALINSEAPIAAPRVLRILMQCCASLSEAHSVGIVHRDIKPENIYVESLAGNQDFVKLFDFSIAKHSNFALTAAGTILGTPEYMSPEQADGVKVDHRSDIYSLGVVAYIMLRGGPLFPFGPPLEILRRHMTEIPAPLPDFVPSPIAKLVLSCLEKNPDDRPSSALELLEAAQVWLSNLDPTADLASEPSLRNTINSMPYKTGTSQMPAAPAPAKSVVKTMLGAVGASELLQIENYSKTQASKRKKPNTLLHAGGGPSLQPEHARETKQIAPSVALPGVCTTQDGLGQSRAAAPQQSAVPQQSAPHQQSAVPQQQPKQAPSASVPAGSSQATLPPQVGAWQPISASPQVAEPHSPGDSFHAITQRSKSPLFWIFCALLAFGLGFAAFYLATKVG